MKSRAFLAVVAGFLVLVVAGLAWLWPDTGGAPAAVAPPSASVTPESGSGDTAQEAAADARREAISAAYGELTAARKALRQKLGDLKALTWGREWPAAQARAAGEGMMAAQYLLQSPAQLGAFSDVDGVRSEQARVQAALVKLQEIEAELGAAEAPH